MWKAALVANVPTVAELDGVVRPDVEEALDRMLYDADDPDTCFHAEIREMGHSPPTLSQMRRSGGRVYVVGARGSLLGAVGVDTQRSPPHLHSLCVDPLRRGEGVGELLLGRVLREHPELELTVWRPGRAYERLLVFYRRLGFRVRHDRGHYTAMVRTNRGVPFC